MTCSNCSPPKEILKSVNQWMQRTVSLSLMYSGSNFVWSTMPATRSKGPPGSIPAVSTEASLVTSPSEINPSPNSSQVNCIPQQLNSNQMWSSRELVNKPPITQASSDKDYFVSQSMNQTVRLVREKFNKIQSSSEHLQAESASKKPRVDNRRRI